MDYNNTLQTPKIEIYPPNFPNIIASFTNLPYNNYKYLPYENTRDTITARRSRARPSR